MHFLTTSFYVYHTLISFSPHYLLLNPGICSLCQHSPTLPHYLCLLSSPTLKAWACSFFLFLYCQHKNTQAYPHYYLACPSTLYKCFMIDIFLLTNIWHLYILIWLCNIYIIIQVFKISLGSLSSITLLSSQLICPYTEYYNENLLKSLYLWVNSSRVNICK